MVLDGGEGLECEVLVNRILLDHVSEFKNLECVLGELGTDKAEHRRKVTNGRKVAGPVMSLVNTRGLQLECARVLHKILLVPVLMIVVRH